MTQNMREDGVMTVSEDNEVIVIYLYEENTILITLYNLI